MAILFFVMVFSSMGFGLVLPPFIFVAQNFGATPMFAAFIVSTFAIGQFVATPVWGRLSDRHGRKPVLIATMLGSAGAYGLMAWADATQSVGMLLLSRLMTGLMAGNFAAAMAYVADITPPEKRAQGMGLVGGAMSIGFIAGPALGGLLSGTTAATASLLGPALLAVGASLLTMVAIILFVRESLPPEQRSSAGSAAAGLSMAGSVLEMLRRPIIAPLALMGFLVLFAMTSFETTFPLWANAGFEWGPRQVGFCFMYLGLIVTVTQIFIVGKLAPVFGEGRLLQMAVGSYMFGLLFMAVVPFLLEPPRWQLMMLGITFTAMGGALFNTASTSWVSKHAGDRERGSVLGLFQSAGWLGRSVGPTFSGLMFQTLGANSPLFAGALLLAPVLFIISAIRRRDIAPQPVPSTAP